MPLISVRLIKNIFGLYAVQGATAVLPLITVPYLTRTLGIESFGLLAFAQSYMTVISVPVEYGFNFSAAREAAKLRHSREGLADLLAGVLGAKALLAILGMAMAYIGALWIGQFRENPGLLAIAIFWAIAQSTNLIWFYQGLERLKVASTLEVATKVVTTAGVFLFVHAPADVWKVIALQGSAAALSTAVMLALAYREVGIRIPRWRDVRNALQLGWHFMVFRLTESVYTGTNSFFLGLWASQEAVGYYAGAEKISRAVYSLLDPISRAIYLRMNHIVLDARENAAELMRGCLAVMGGCGVAMTIGIIAFAPRFVHILLGPNFGPAVPVLRILSILPLAIALKNVIGFHWMMPMRMDRALSRVVAGSAVFHGIMMLALVPRFADMGMAAAVVSTESAIVIALYLIVRLAGRDPLQRRKFAAIAVQDAETA